MESCRKISSRWVTLIALSLCGCGPTVLAPTTHEPSNPEHVKIYQKPPGKYEDLGTISLNITPDLRWDKNGDADAAFDAMKAKAAALGANGILLQVAPFPDELLTAAGYRGEYYQVPMRGRTVFNEAIYVLKE